ncbi:MAG: cobalt-zinc-cadmium efflux system protein [Bacteroidia bacterium]|jgi:cobalt-zinc-cadmium efflux system protein
MILFAIIEIAVNGYAAWKMSGGTSLNEKIVSKHLLKYVLGWIAILVTAIIQGLKNIEYLKASNLPQFQNQR